MGALLPLLLPAIPSIINLVEGLFSGKPKSGPDKMDAVLQAIRAIVGKMVMTGQIEKQPTDDALTGVVEAVLAQMRAGGILGQPQTGSDTLWIVRGTVTQLK